MQQKFSCPACGAPLTLQNRFVKIVTCDFCHQVSLVKDNGLDPTGKTAKLTELPSRLYLDATGAIGGMRFRVLGRLRYQYAAGFWDEWFLLNDGNRPAWLVEDEGTYTLFYREPITVPPPPFATIQVGGALRVNQYNVFVVEKRAATISGSEGQLGFLMLPGEKVNYVDGAANGQALCLEYAENEIELLVGQTYSYDDLQVDDEE